MDASIRCHKKWKMVELQKAGVKRLELKRKFTYNSQ